MKSPRPSATSVWSAITDHAPIAHQLKSRLADRWVRFYSLPEAKRYATDRAEHQVVLARANELLQATIGRHSQVLLVTGQLWPATDPELSTSQAMVHTNPEHWYTQPDSDAEDPDWPLHLWTSWEDYERGSFDDVIALTAESSLIEVMLVCMEVGVVLHPYDGGMDVFMPTSAGRDNLRTQFAQWASPLPTGL